MKRLVLMRGLPGSGKSTLVKQLATQAVQNGAKSIAICSTDDFFVGWDGVYKFEAEKLFQNHMKNQRMAELMISNGVEVVFIDNTNTTEREMKPYKDFARQYNYSIDEIIVGEGELFPGMEGSPHKFNEYLDLCAKRNTHGVPRETIEKMARRFQR